MLRAERADVRTCGRSGVRRASGNGDAGGARRRDAIFHQQSAICPLRAPGLTCFPVEWVVRHVIRRKKDADHGKLARNRPGDCAKH